MNAVVVLVPDVCFPFYFVKLSPVERTVPDFVKILLPYETEQCRFRSAGFIFTAFFHSNDSTGKVEKMKRPA